MKTTKELADEVARAKMIYEARGMQNTASNALKAREQQAEYLIAADVYFSALHKLNRRIKDEKG